MKIFKVIVTLKTPSEEGLKADFRKKSKDVFEAAAFFNNKFARWNKRIFVSNIEPNKISMLLIKEVIDDDTVISPLEIGIFSRFLYHNKKWSVYSRETSKLFASIMFKEINNADAMKIVTETEDKSGVRDEFVELIGSDKGSVSEPAQPVGIEADKPENNDGGAEEKVNYGNSVIADELAIKAFQFLLDTQYIGKTSPEKKKAVAKIKAILFEWLEN